MRTVRTLVAGSAALLLATRVHAAEPTPAPPTASPPAQSTPGARADAEKRLAEGLDRYSRGDFEGARLAFAQAYAVLASLDLLYNLMRAEVKSGHPLEALVHIHQLLRDPGATPEDRAKAQKLLDDANAMTGHVAVEAPAGAEVVLDDVPSGEAPFKEVFDVAPGKHKIEARGGGSKRRIDVDVPAGQTVTTRFALDVGIAPSASAPVPVPATTPPAPSAPAPAQATPAAHDAEPAPRESNARIVVPVVVGAAAVVAAGIGAGMSAVASGKSSDASAFRASNPSGFCTDRTSGACTQYQSILDGQQGATNASRALLVTGGVLAVAAVVTYVVWPKARKEHAAWIVPTAGGAALGATF